jgi:protein-tyrosine phosphatase
LVDIGPLKRQDQTMGVPSGTPLFLCFLFCWGLFMVYRIVFVCLGNICRSPSAENIMNLQLKARGLAHQVECDSAGTSGYHVGSAPDSRMNVAAKRKLGIELGGRSRKFQAFDFDEFDLIVAMDRDNYRQIAILDPTMGKHAGKVRLMCDFCTTHSLKEVPDPYYGGEDGFNFVIELLEDACAGLIDHLLATKAIAQ